MKPTLFESLWFTACTLSTKPSNNFLGQFSGEQLKIKIKAHFSGNSGFPSLEFQEAAVWGLVSFDMLFRTFKGATAPVFSFALFSGLRPTVLGLS